MSLIASKKQPVEITGPWDLGPSGKVWSSEGLTFTGGESVREYINNLAIPKVLIPDGPTHDWWWSWTTSLWSHPPSSLKGYGNQEGVLRTGTKQTPPLTSRRATRCMKESHRLISLPLISGKRMGPIILQIISKHMKDMKDQQGFVKGKSCLMTWKPSSIK